jgi:hypothetical protein
VFEEVVIAWAKCPYFGPLMQKWIGPGLAFLKMLPNNRRIQSGEKGLNGIEWSYGKSRFRGGTIIRDLSE